MAWIGVPSRVLSRRRYFTSGFRWSVFFLVGLGVGLVGFVLVRPCGIRWHMLGLGCVSPCLPSGGVLTVRYVLPCSY